MTSKILMQKKVGFIGVGNMSQSVLGALIDSSTLKPDQVYASNRSAGKLHKVKDKWGIHVFENNEELIDACDVVFLGMKPQDLSEAMEPIAHSFHDGHIVISFAAGIRLDALKHLFPGGARVVRVMPNTPTKIQKGVIGYAVSADDPSLEAVVEDLLSPLGYVVKVQEDEAFEAFTVAASCGVGFVYDFMMYFQEWLLDQEFSLEEARKIVVQTFLGTAELAAHQPETSLEDLQVKVTSKKGVTEAGLNAMREQEIERALRVSFEKAVLRDRELGKSF